LTLNGVNDFLIGGPGSARGTGLQRWLGRDSNFKYDNFRIQYGR
jgi:hypothetical protein